MGGEPGWVLFKKEDWLSSMPSSRENGQSV
jgi:hypothetical protein